MYADDIILLCPSMMGLQAMMKICEKFAGENNLKFSTNVNPKKSKTKCIHFSKHSIELARITLNGDLLPWVDSALHVGNTLERNNSFTKDLTMKRGSFIGRIHSILQELHFANPLVKMKMFLIYTTSFYGSSLWNIFSGPCERLYTAWNISVRMAFDIPRETHRFFIEEISESEVLKGGILGSRIPGTLIGKSGHFSWKDINRQIFFQILKKTVLNLSI